MRREATILQQLHPRQENMYWLPPSESKCQTRRGHRHCTETSPSNCAETSRLCKQQCTLGSPDCGRPSGKEAAKVPTAPYHHHSAVYNTALQRTGRALLPAVSRADVQRALRILRQHILVAQRASRMSLRGCDPACSHCARCTVQGDGEEQRITAELAIEPS